MGAVYKAEHPTLNRYVALKRLVMRGSASFAERFRREARIMMDFKNDRIVDVYDHFKEKSSYYIVEEYVDGTSLDRLIRRERYLPNDIALAIFLECCRALKYAHDQGVIHRDIKPANILISRQGKVKLSDFGIATSQESDEEGLTRDGMTLGTLPYIAPEQIRNSRSVDKRADIYAMGAMLYEMVTGKPPFPRTFNPETLNRIQKGSYLAPTRLNPRIAPQVRKIIKRCLKVNPRRRYQDLGEIVRFLARYFRRWDPIATREAIHRFIHRQEVGSIRRRRIRLLSWALTGLGVLALLAGAGYYLLLERGYYYEVIRAREYGALRVAARVQAGVKEPDRIFLQAALFQEAGEEVLPVEEARFRFTEREEPQGADSFTLESQRLYLKAGEYRIKVKLEDQLFWQSFYLAPRALQRQDLQV
jgi:serine/threonine-protein kinase